MGKKSINAVPFLLQKILFHKKIIFFVFVFGGGKNFPTSVSGEILSLYRIWNLIINGDVGGQ